jgi:hypothetical protein
MNSTPLAAIQSMARTVALAPVIVAKFTRCAAARWSSSLGIAFSRSGQGGGKACCPQPAQAARQPSVAARARAACTPLSQAPPTVPA